MSGARLLARLLLMVPALVLGAVGAVLFGVVVGPIFLGKWGWDLIFDPENAERWPWEY